MREMLTGDGKYIKRLNRRLILKEIIKNKFISRADLAKITGLNKATISVQVAELLEENLIYETRQEHNTIGRRPIMLSANEKAGYILGIDLDYPTIHFQVSDLHGTPVEKQIFHIQTKEYEKIKDILVKQINKYVEYYVSADYGLISAIVGIHGTVDKDEKVHFVPKLNWSQKDLKGDLSKEIGIDIYLENNANLSAYAERVYHYHENNNMLTIILTSAIGAGIINDGKIHKGYHGYAGEMGHMIIEPNGIPCACGNHGCYEQYASEPALLKELSRLLNQDDITIDDLELLITERNPIAIEAIKTFLSYLAIGLNNIINLYNPETVVINSKVLNMYPNAISELESNLTSSVSQYGKIALSQLGTKACILGATALGIKKFFEVPELFLTLPDSNSVNETVEPETVQ